MRPSAQTIARTHDGVASSGTIDLPAHWQIEAVSALPRRVQESTFATCRMFCTRRVVGAAMCFIATVTVLIPVLFVVLHHDDTRSSPPPMPSQPPAPIACHGTPVTCAARDLAGCVLSAEDERAHGVRVSDNASATNITALCAALVDEQLCVSQYFLNASAVVDGCSGGISVGALLPCEWEASRRTCSPAWSARPYWYRSLPPPLQIRCPEDALWEFQGQFSSVCALTDDVLRLTGATTPMGVDRYTGSCEAPYCSDVPAVADCAKYVDVSSVSGLTGSVERPQHGEKGTAHLVQSMRWILGCGGYIPTNPTPTVLLWDTPDYDDFGCDERLSPSPSDWPTPSPNLPCALMALPFSEVCVLTRAVLARRHIHVRHESTCGALTDAGTCNRTFVVPRDASARECFTATSAFNVSKTTRCLWDHALRLCKDREYSPYVVDARTLSNSRSSPPRSLQPTTPPPTTPRSPNHH